MKLKFIATLANQKVRLRFLALERSLREQGCDLPIRVIPFDDHKFELPHGSEWWENAEFFAWLSSNGGNAYMRRYICLSEKCYQFIDTDAVFLKNPSLALQRFTGFITCCSHWHNPGHTQTATANAHFAKTSTTWQRNVFNSGQFACDQPLWDLSSLQKVMLRADMRDTCLKFKHHDQPGVNLLVLRSGIPITNLTLPPICLKSSWAGDYMHYPHHYWANDERMPYLIHWAGLPIFKEREIDQLFLRYFSVVELSLWRDQCSQAFHSYSRQRSSLQHTFRRIKKAYTSFSES